MYIKEVRIHNFRSLNRVELPLNNISLFVGLNDVGKSNVLKALNLFFNNETDYDQSLNFNSDYCKYATKRQKKADEIIIEVILNPPRNYKGSKDIKWTKIWRRSGLHSNEMKFLDGALFPKKSKLSSWAQSVRYTYVPAIRDNSYFKLLLAQLHDALAETIEQELRDAGDDFIKKIKRNTISLVKGIDDRLNITSEIQLPANLQSLFRTLDFLTSEGEFQISLSNRGDGVKTRHIPVILKFIASQLNINRVKGAANISMIWGYEEPENNLEMTASFNLAKEFVDYTQDIQLLVTTHSPGFYNLKEKNNATVTLYKVTKEKNKPGEVSPISNYTDLHTDMGVMPLIAPFIDEKVNEINTLKEDLESYKKQISKTSKHVVFVEGNDEVLVFSKILERKNLQEKIVVNKDGLGSGGVKSQLMAWSWVASVNVYKAIGVFDSDKSGINEYNKLITESQFIDSQSKGYIKAIYYKAPKHLINIKSKLPNFPIEIEEMYIPEAWDHAENQGWLVDRTVDELNSFVHLDTLLQSLTDKISSFSFNGQEQRYIFKKVPDNHKDKLSKFAATDNASKNYLSAIEELFDTYIIPFLTKA